MGTAVYVSCTALELIPVAEALFMILAVLPLLAWVFVSALACYAVWDFANDIVQTINSQLTADIVVIIPIRGIPETLDILWERLSSQSLAPRRVLFAVESVDDPAYGALQGLIATKVGPPAEIVVAGTATDTGQKVWGQLAALRHLDKEDTVVFADADILPDFDWLARTAMALQRSNAMAVSGYRWMMPTDNRLATALVCMANSSIATAGRLPRMTLAWGGTMAIRRETLDAIGIERWWRGSIDDDLQLTRAIWSLGGYVFSPPELLVPSPASYGWREAISFGRRQYLLVRIYTPLHWALSCAATTVPLLGWAVAIPRAFDGSWIAIAAVVIANALDMTRAHLRRRIVGKLWGPAAVAQLSRLLRMEIWATPFYLGFHAMIIWSTVFSRTIRWGGRRYRVDGPQSLRIIA